MTEDDTTDARDAAEGDARAAADARREAEALRRDREKAERASAKEAARAERDLENARRARERDERDAARQAERRERDAAKEVERRQAEQERREREAAKDVERRQAEQERREREAAKDVERRQAEQERREREAVKEVERRQTEREREARAAAKEAGRALREAEKAQRDAALAQQRAAREAERARLVAERAERADRGGPGPVDDAGLAGLPRDVAVLWRTPAPGRRGPRPGLTLEQIADAAIALADAEGLAAVSMARLAESLGFTTMSLYRYVSSKDEVVALMSDRASGRPPAVGPEAGDWRARLELLLALQRPVMQAHPWLAQSSTVLHAHGPNRLLWMDAMLAALEDTPLAEAEKVGAIGALAAHVLDEARLWDAMTARERALAADPEAEGGDEAVLARLARHGGHSALLRAVEAGAFGLAPADAEGTAADVVGHAETSDAPVAEAGGSDDDAPSFGTRLILDGIAALVQRASDRPG